MYCVIFRFRLTDAPNAEARFIKAWTGITEFFQNHAKAGASRLHKDKDGSFVSYAEWSDVQSYERSQEIDRTQEFIRHAVEWSEVCVPSEIIFEGELINNLAAS